ncbi:DUF6083 domain-containing protein [Streptomyces sp. NPDC001744]|uniref:DUF6083 domain-containing protein n=1 Tax=Streptomyces sp. NPDC001744 TaxID=3364606 RepID=UPI0036CC0737
MDGEGSYELTTSLGADMVAGRWSAECDFCGAPYGTWVASLGMALCSECERTGADRPAREPVLVGDVLAGLADAVSSASRPGSAVPDARGPSSTACRGCGARTERHRTARGRWVPVEPGELAVRAVPADLRWRVAGDGTVVGPGATTSSGTCRISHLDVCPTRPAPVGAPVLLALWRGHARRVAWPEE